MNQNAPSVEYPVGRFVWGACLALVFAALSMLGLVMGLTSGLFELWQAASLGGTWLLLSTFSLLTLRSQQGKSWLCWDGHEWQIVSLLSLPVPPTSQESTPSPGLRLNQPPVDLALHDGYAISVHLDFQQYLLVSLASPISATQWFWVSKSAFPERWHGFRCAVYSHFK